MSQGTSPQLDGSVEAVASSEILWISSTRLPQNVAQSIPPGFRLRPLGLWENVVEAIQESDSCLAMIYPPNSYTDVRRVSFILDELDRTSTVALVLVDPGHCPFERALKRRGQFAVARTDDPPDVIVAHLQTLLRVQPALRNLHRELTQVRTFGADIGSTMDHIDEEMRLAARLQRDFLPKNLPAIGPVRFSSLFRPASWVSGDIFDVIRLDENHVGFYVADAVGHGLPAALLTIFIKQALPTKRVVGNSYTIVPPDQAIAELNKAICDQDLSSCQFCTALYGIINVRTLELVYARGGHPPAIWLHADGSTTELDVQGGLLGVFPEERFEAGRIRLTPGDRLLLHTDGSEDVFRRQGTSGRDEFIEVVQRVRHLPLETMMMELTNTIDAQQGSLNPEDDVTLLALNVAKK